MSTRSAQRRSAPWHTPLGVARVGAGLVGAALVGVARVSAGLVGTARVGVARFSAGLVGAALVGTAALVVTATLTSCAGPGPTSAGVAGSDPSNTSASSSPAPGPPPSAHWRRVADAPLESRSELVTAWVGDRFLVVGGSVTAPCPPNADCVAVPGADRREAAWYDPGTDTWTPTAPRR